MVIVLMNAMAAENLRGDVRELADGVVVEVRGHRRGVSGRGSAAAECSPAARGNDQNGGCGGYRGPGRAADARERPNGTHRPFGWTVANESKQRDAVIKWGGPRARSRVPARSREWYRHRCTRCDADAELWTRKRASVEANSDVLS